VKGNLQRDGIDVGDRYSPTLSKDLLRVMVAVAVKLGLTLKQMDVFRGENVGVLKKALYRLKQAPLLWCEHLSGVLVSMGFGRCKVDPCVYAREVGFCIVPVYVNDLLICSESDEAVKIVKTHLTHHFTITDMRELKEIVGWNINKISNRIKIDQSSFFRRLAHNMKVT
jgi:Reverse transcriptase (RNA-dependent DNA polymerase)